MIDIDVADTYLEFVTERHWIWAQRQRGDAQPWTADPVLASRKFTNVFRILDWDSQFLVRELLDEHPADTLMRCFLFRHTGRREAWEFFDVMHGRMPDVQDLMDGTLLETWKTYRGEGRTKLKNIKPPAERSNKAAGHSETVFKRTVFTSAYLVFPQSSVRGTDKLESIIALARRLFVGDRVDQAFFAGRNQAQRFGALHANKGVGDFMSMQILTDWGYTPHCGEDREDEFVVCGPGAKRGAAAINPSAKAEDVVRWAQAEIHEQELALLPLDDHSGEYRAPSLMDVQNTLCEFSKYLKGPRATSYTPAHPGPQPTPLLPNHWS